MGHIQFRLGLPMYVWKILKLRARSLSRFFLLGRIGSELSTPRSNTGVWRATGWEIVQHFLAQQSK
jgi:hypothetical protein